MPVSPEQAMTSFVFPPREEQGVSLPAGMPWNHTAPEDLSLQGLASRLRAKFGVVGAPVTIVLDGLSILRRLLSNQLQIAVTTRGTATASQSTGASGGPNKPTGKAASFSESSPLRCSVADTTGGDSEPVQQHDSDGFTFLDALLCLASSSGAAGEGPAEAAVTDALHHLRVAFFSYLYKLRRMTGCHVHAVFPSTQAFLASAAATDPSQSAVRSRVQRGLAAQVTGTTVTQPEHDSDRDSESDSDLEFEPEPSSMADSDRILASLQRPAASAQGTPHVQVVAQAAVRAMIVSSSSFPPQWHW